MQSTYNQSGSYTALFGIGVAILAHFGVITDTASLASIVGGVIAIVGIVKQYIAHKKLALASGVAVK